MATHLDEDFGRRSGAQLKRARVCDVPPEESMHFKSKELKQKPDVVKRRRRNASTGTRSWQTRSTYAAIRCCV